MGYDPLGRRTTFSKGSSNKTCFYLGQSLLSDGSSRFLQGAGIDQPLQLDTSLGLKEKYMQAFINRLCSFKPSYIIKNYETVIV